MLKLPPHTSHFLKPLDFSVFKYLKNLGFKTCDLAKEKDWTENFKNVLSELEKLGRA